MASAATPPIYKPIVHYLKLATEHEKRDPVVSYYCKLYAFQKAMTIDKSSADARSYLLVLMDQLESIKAGNKENEAIQNELVGQAHVEHYALKLFLYADNEDRASRFGKNVVKSFYSAGLLFDVLTNFGELSEDIEANRKYAKWKAAYIHKCLQNGEQPIAGPLPEEDEEGTSGAFTDPQPGTSSQGGYSQPPATSSHQPSSIPSDPTILMPNPPQSKPSEISTGSVRPEVPEWHPPPTVGAAKLTSDGYNRAMKLCKYASSALQYEDSPTAIDNLQKALRLLQTGKE